MRTALVTILYDKTGVADFIVYLKNDESKLRIIEHNTFNKLDDNISYSGSAEVSDNFKRIHLLLNETNTLYYDCFIFKRVTHLREMHNKKYLLFSNVSYKLQDVLNKIKDK